MNQEHHYLIVLTKELRYHRENPGRDVIIPNGTELKAIPPALWDKEQRDYARRETARNGIEVHICWWGDRPGEWHALEYGEAEVKGFNSERIAAATSVPRVEPSRVEQQPIEPRPSFVAPSPTSATGQVKRPALRLRIGPDAPAKNP